MVQKPRMAAPSAFATKTDGRGGRGIQAAVSGAVVTGPDASVSSWGSEG